MRAATLAPRLANEAKKRRLLDRVRNRGNRQKTVNIVKVETTESDAEARSTVMQSYN